jgi:hypothetical protein
MPIVMKKKGYFARQCSDCMMSHHKRQQWTKSSRYCQGYTALSGITEQRSALELKCSMASNMQGKRHKGNLCTLHQLLMPVEILV